MKSNIIALMILSIPIDCINASHTSDKTILNIVPTRSRSITHANLPVVDNAQSTERASAHAKKHSPRDSLAAKEAHAQGKKRASIIEILNNAKKLSRLGLIKYENTYLLDFNEIDAQGKTALMIAVEKNLPHEIIQYLIADKKIDITKQDSSGNTALILILAKIIEMKRENEHREQPEKAAIENAVNNALYLISEMAKIENGKSLIRENKEKKSALSLTDDDYQDPRIFATLNELPIIQDIIATQMQ